MCEISELKLSEDHRCILHNNTWIQLDFFNRPIENLNVFLKEQCKACPAEKMSKCLLSGDRKLYHDMEQNLLADRYEEEGTIWI
jgi:hypothetical protein